MRDIVVTWPSRRPLRSYLSELEKAKKGGLVINYRIVNPPRSEVDRCYLVHGGKIVGYNEVIEIVRRGEGMVADVGGGFWPAGWYVVRKPDFHPTKLVPMRGFQGWRYFEDREAVASESRD